MRWVRGPMVSVGLTSRERVIILFVGIIWKVHLEPCVNRIENGGDFLCLVKEWPFISN